MLPLIKFSVVGGAYPSCDRTAVFLCHSKKITFSGVVKQVPSGPCAG